MLACAMRLPVLALPALALLLVSLPAFAQPVAAPDCTVDVAVSAGPKLDITYRCRSTKPVTFAADDATVAAHVQDLHDGGGAKVTASGQGWMIQPVNGLAEARYRYDLADYARTVNKNSSAVLRGQGALVSL